MSNPKLHFMCRVGRMGCRALALAAAMLLVLVLTLECLERALHRPYGRHAVFLRDTLRDKDDVELLFLGQSDVRSAIVPSLFPVKTANVANGGETFIETYYKLKAYIAQFPRLRAVTLPVDLCSFASSRTDKIDSDYYSYFISFADLPELSRWLGPGVWKFKLLSYVSVLEADRVRGLLEQAEKKNGRAKPASSGAILDAEQEMPSERHAPQRVEHFFSGSAPFDPALLSYFRKILELCRLHGIPVITITYPVTGEYVESARPHISREDLQTQVLENPEYRPFIAHHLDYLEWCPDCPSYYKNADHLNRRGAMAFSRQVAADLQLLLEEGRDSSQPKTADLDSGNSRPPVDRPEKSG